MHILSRVSVQTHIAKRCDVETKIKTNHELDQLA
jgi:hypothetical protein